MYIKEIVNSQDYKATKVAIEWWYSLPEEQRRATDVDAEPDVVDAYADGVIYGWNNPHWTSVEKLVPNLDDDVLVYDSAENRMFVAHHAGDWYTTHGDILLGVTHWMPIVRPRKDEDNE